MEGVVYKYTSPSGKVYIGQTSNEKRRRSEFFRINQSYGGSKMDNARKNMELKISYMKFCSGKNLTTWVLWLKL